MNFKFNTVTCTKPSSTPQLSLSLRTSCECNNTSVELEILQLRNALADLTALVAAIPKKYILEVIVDSGHAGVKTYTNTLWEGASMGATVEINNIPYQGNTDFTFNPETGTLDFTLCGHTLQIGEVITGDYFK